MTSLSYVNPVGSSYTDYVLISRHFEESVAARDIIFNLPDNDNDHLPLHTSEHYDIQRFRHIDGSNADNYNLYNDTLSAVQLSMAEPSSITAFDEAGRVINSICQQLSTTMHDGCEQVNIMKHPKFKGLLQTNRWWNVDCPVTRDCHRLWYSVWRPCPHPRTDMYMTTTRSRKMHIYQQVVSNANVRRVTGIYQFAEIQKRQAVLERGLTTKSCEHCE